MGPFAGFDMPISYPSGAVEEHLICRRSVGLFDIDHMGQVELSGQGATEYLSGLVSARVINMVNFSYRNSCGLQAAAKYVAAGNIG